MTDSVILKTISAVRAMTASLTEEEGAGLAEYALLLLLIAIVCVGALTVLGTTISGAYNTANGMFN